MTTVSGLPQLFMQFTHKLSDWKKDPDIFQRCAKIACAILRIMVSYPPANTLLFVFSTVDLHDAFMVSKIPESVKNLIYPINKDSTETFSIDIEKQKEKLISFFDNDKRFTTTGKTCEFVNNFFSNNFMQKGKTRYTEFEFREAIKEEIEKDRFDKYFNVTPADITEALADVPICYRATKLERINHWMWVAVSISCLTHLLQSWNFIDTAKLAESIGQYSVFQCIKDGTLEEVVIGFVGASFAIKCIAAFQRLCYLPKVDDTSLNSLQRDKVMLQRRNATNDMIPSFFETALNVAVFASLIGAISIGGVYWQLFVIFTKLIGVVCATQKDSKEKPISLVA